MNHLKVLLCSIIGIVCLLSGQVFAQEALFSEDFDAKDSLQAHLIEMIDGDIFRGHVTNTEADSFSFMTQRNIIIKVGYNEVKSVTVIKKSGKQQEKKQHKKRKVSIKLWAEESKIETVKEGEEKKQKILYPQSMFIHSTAFRAIPKGIRLYQNIDLYINSWDYGLDNGVSVGIQVFPALVNLRLRYNHSFSEEIHIGGSANIINYYELGNLFQGATINGDIILYPYGIFTYGTPKLYLNTTVGVLFPTSKYPVSLEERRGLFTVGFGGQENKFIYKGVLSIYKGVENYYDPSTNTGGSKIVWTITPGFSLGWIGRKIQVDLGAVLLVNAGFPLPYLSLKKRLK